VKRRRRLTGQLVFIYATLKCRSCKRPLWKKQCHAVTCPRYLNGDRLRFKAGRRVVVKRHEREGVRIVERVYSDIDGGRRLDRPVDGFVSWNVTDLRIARRSKR